MEVARWIAFVATSLALAPALAIDPGVARGELVVDGQTIHLTHAYALQRDDESGRRELRIVLADREIPQNLLSGVVPSALHALARSGGVQGVLLTMDPRKPAAGLHGVLLLAQPDPARALATFAKDSADRGRFGPRFGNNRVWGEVRHESMLTQPAFAVVATYDAPLFREERPAPQRGSSSVPASFTANATRPRSRSRRRCSRRSGTVAEPCA